MNNYVKILLIGGAVVLTLNYLKKKKKETEIKQIVEPEGLSSIDLDTIRINLLRYIETRNSDMGISKSREEIDHDIMYITDVKK